MKLSTEQLKELIMLDEAGVKLRLGDNYISQIITECLESRDEIERLREALSTLRNEVQGILRAHELAIRYDSGNSNWNCLEMALAMADQALSPKNLEVKEPGYLGDINGAGCDPDVK